MTTRAENQMAVRQPQGFRNGLGRFGRRYALQLGIIAVLLILWVILILAAPLTFQSRDIYLAFMSSIPFFGVIALPLTLLIIAKEIDLSFGSVMAISMVGFLTVFNATGSVPLAFIVALAVGGLAGLVNGLIVVRLGIPSLIATIGMQFFWRGVALVLTNAKGGSMVDAKSSFLSDLLVGRLSDIWPAQIIWMVLVAVAMWILLNRHRFGAHLYLIGDNDNSARLMGVNVNRTRIMIFVLVGVAAAFGGILASLEVGYFWPTLGEGYLLQTLAAVFLGGTSVFGGTGTIIGTFIGCIIIAAIEPATIAVGLTGFWTQLIYGLIIIVSVGMHTFLRKRLG